jgi:hypothetical protein
VLNVANRIAKPTRYFMNRPLKWSLNERKIY